MCRQRSSREEESSRRIKTELLKQMDGLNAPGHASNLLFVLCASNTPWELDTAMLRRFQKRMYVGLPDLETRAEIVRRLLDRAGAGQLLGDELNQVAELTEGYGRPEERMRMRHAPSFSGSDLRGLVAEALYQPIRELETRASWKQKYDAASNSTFWEPASPESEETVQCCAKELPQDRVCPAAGRSTA